MAEVEPVSGPVGTEITVSGAGFRTSEDGITITYDGKIIMTNIVADTVGTTTAVTISAIICIVTSVIFYVTYLKNR
jgi:hypothetical protein